MGTISDFMFYGVMKLILIKISKIQNILTVFSSTPKFI